MGKGEGGKSFDFICFLEIVKERSTSPGTAVIRQGVAIYAEQSESANHPEKGEGSFNHISALEICVRTLSMLLSSN
jgi:hypothetical protein